MKRLATVLTLPMSLGRTHAEPDVPQLIEQLKARKADARIKAADALGELGPKAKAATTALCTAGADESEDVRRAAVQALEKVSPKLHKHVLVLVIEEDPQKHIDACNTLAKLEDAAEPVLPLITARIELAILYLHKLRSIHARPLRVLPEAVRGQARAGSWLKAHFDVLVRVRPDAATLKTLAAVALLDREDYRNYVHARHEALIALGELGDENKALRKQIAATLTKRLEEEEDPADSSGVPLDALALLGRYGADAKVAIPVLTKLKTRKSEGVRKAAVKALREIGTDN
jgi:HEAT repeat protein